MENLNSREYLEKIKVQVLANLERTRHAPSVQMTDVARGLTEHQEEQDAMLDDMDEDGEGMDNRHTQRRWDRTVEKQGELYSDSEDEEMEKAGGVRKTGRKRRRDEKSYKDAGSGTGSGNITPLTGPGGSDAASDTAGGSANKDTGATKRDDARKGSEDDDQNLNEYDEELEALRKDTEADQDGDVEMGGNEKPPQAGDISAIDANNDEEMVDVAELSPGTPSKGDSAPPVEESGSKKPRLDIPATGDGPKPDTKDTFKITGGAGAETTFETPKPTALSSDVALEKSSSTPDGPVPSPAKPPDGPTVAPSSAEEKPR